MSSNNNNIKKAIIAAFIGNAIFGFSFLASKVALNETSVMVLLSARFLIAFLAMTLLAVTGVIKIQLRGKNLMSLIILGIFEPVIYFFFENYGVQMTNSSIGGIIISLIPIVNFFFGSIFLKEHFRKSQLAWAIMSVVGVCILSINGSLTGGINVIGLLFLFGAVFSGATFTVISRHSADEFTAIERTYAMFVIGAIAFPGIGLIQTRGHLFSEVIAQLQNPPFLMAVLYLAIFSSIGAYFCINYSVTYLPIRQSTSFTSMTSIISVVAGAVILHEPVGFVQLIGILLILVGVYMVNRQMSE